MKWFKTGKRIISQWVETEYWYRFRNRKTYFTDSYGRKHIEKHFNAAILADTWNGDWTLFNTLNIKLTHMLFNLRKYGNELNSYIDSGAVVAYGNDSDKKYFYKKFIELLEKFKSENSIVAKDATSEFYSKKLVKNGAIFKYAYVPLYGHKSENFYLIYIEDWDGYTNHQSLWFIANMNEDGCKINNLEELRITTFRHLEKKFASKIIIPIASGQLDIPSILNIPIDEILISVPTFEVPPTEYKCLSKKLRKHLRGNRIKLHTIWQFRKMLKDYQRFSEDIQDDNTMYNNAQNIEDFVVRYKTFDKIIETEIHKKQKEYLYKIVDFFVDNSGSWWD